MAELIEQVSFFLFIQILDFFRQSYSDCSTVGVLSEHVEKCSVLFKEDYIRFSFSLDLKKSVQYLWEKNSERIVITELDF